MRALKGVKSAQGVNFWGFGKVAAGLARNFAAVNFVNFFRKFTKNGAKSVKNVDFSKKFTDFSEKSVNFGVNFVADSVNFAKESAKSVQSVNFIKKFTLCALFAALCVNFSKAEPIQEINFAPSDTGNIEIIDLNITPMKSAFSTDITASVTSRDGAFVKSSTGEGSGKSKEEATRNAILDAIARMRGLSAQKNLSLNPSKPALLGQMVNSNQMAKATQGRIDTYEITNIDTEPNGDYVVRVNVYKSVFERGKAPSIIVLSNSVFKNLGKTLQTKLVNELAQSKKFSVLERKNEAYYKAEKALIESEDASSEDIYKLGNVLGTDYMLVFNLRDIGKAAKKGAGVAATKSSAAAVKADIAVDYRVIVFATREIKLANTITLTLTLKDDSVKSNEEALAKIAKAVSSDILGTLYPLIVADIADKEVSFGEKLALNAVYQCGGGVGGLNGGGASVGGVSLDGARVQITKSAAGLSKGKILEGELELGDECRLFDELNAAGRGANYKLDGKGGVNLGW